MTTTALKTFKIGSYLASAHYAKVTLSQRQPRLSTYSNGHGKMSQKNVKPILGQEGTQRFKFHHQMNM